MPREKKPRRGEHDNLYNRWTKDHSPNQCIWRIVDPADELEWEETCRFNPDSNEGSHWRCGTCKQGTGNQIWRECPYEQGNTLEHLVYASHLELRKEE